MSLMEKVCEILNEYSLQDSRFAVSQSPLIKKIEEKIGLDEELVFILPAFPAKSPSPDKTSGKLPDFGEVLALQNLENLCQRLTVLHPAGARVVICSDGRVFSDVVDVSDMNIDLYNEGIKAIIQEYDLKSLSVFSMDDLYPDADPEKLRSLLLDFYAMKQEEVKELVLTNENYRNLFNGIHRFLFEDALSMNQDRSKNFVHKETKKRAYELMRRSDAWSSLLNEHFRDALRLSIHPHPAGHEKFGIKLVPGSNKWATPWHNVVVKIKNNFELMHRKEAQKLNAILRMEKDKYAYFEVPAFQ